MNIIWTQPDPQSDSYFNELAALIEASDGLSPVFATQWRTLAKAVVTLRTIITGDLDAVRGDIASVAGRLGYGSGAIPAGASSVSVAHGLAAIPAVVLVSPACPLDGADLWHETPDAAQFTVATSTAPAAPVTFDWLAALPAS